ncbi:hypothetical protein [Tellurirhabdus bombi]|uniref:hypothetical protein n=1 Tax=Tellurirhabdus bombi TaxID=2907205 RepID=UPI001F3F59BB|nr:hypothetical protein [Tellurirhabdus bombi]
MKTLFFLIFLIILSVIAALFTGKTTITDNVLEVKRPLVFVGTLLLLMGLSFLVAAFKHEILVK